MRDGEGCRADYRCPGRLLPLLRVRLLRRPRARATASRGQSRNSAGWSWIQWSKQWRPVGREWKKPRRDSKRIGIVHARKRLLKEWPLPGRCDTNKRKTASEESNGD